MKTVYLHIGMPKTGTKSLQKFLTVNKQALKKHGYACPKVPIKYESATEWKNAHFFIETLDYNMTITDKVKRHMLIYRGMKYVKKSLKSADCLLMSSEGIWNADFKYGKVIETIKKQINRIGADLKVVVYLRRQDDYIVSIWNQLVKKKGYTEDFQTFLKEGVENQSLDYFQELRKIEGVVGYENLIVRVYEKGQFEGKNHDLFSDYLRAVGLEYTGAFKPLKNNMNSSLYGNYVEIRRILNENDEYRHLMGDPALPAIRKASERYDKQPVVFDGKARQEFLNQYQESNAKVASRYLLREDEILFYEKPNMSVETEQGRPEEIIDDMVHLICVMLEGCNLEKCQC